MRMRTTPRRARGWTAVLLMWAIGPLAGCGTGGEDGVDTPAQSAAGSADLGGGGDDAADPAGKDLQQGAAERDDDDAETAEAPDTAVVDLAASVNGAPLALADFQAQALDTQRYFVDQGLDPNTDAGQQQLLALRRQVLREMVNQALFEQESASRGITATNQEVEASLAAYRQQAADSAAFDAARAAAGTSEAELFEMERQAIIGRKLVDDISRDLPTTAPFYHARHILCTAEADCRDALDRLTAGEDFAAVAREVSRDEVSATEGGDLGWIPIIDGFNYLPSAELERVIAGLQAGQRSAVVQTDYGHHIVEVVEIEPARAIDADLGAKLREKRVHDWLAEQHDRADIVIYIEDLQDALEDAGSTP